LGRREERASKVGETEVRRIWPGRDEKTHSGKKGFLESETKTEGGEEKQLGRGEGHRLENKRLRVTKRSTFERQHDFNE